MKWTFVNISNDRIFYIQNMTDSIIIRSNELFTWTTKIIIFTSWKHRIHSWVFFCEEYASNQILYFLDLTLIPMIKKSKINWFHLFLKSQSIWNSNFSAFGSFQNNWDSWNERWSSACLWKEDLKICFRKRYCSVPIISVELRA
jgi:hypothetical protein